MKKEHFRLVVGAAVILVHAACFLIIFYGKDAYLSPRQRIDVALLFMPITAAYVVAIVRAATENPSPTAITTPVNLNYAIIVMLVIAITLLGLLWTVAALTGNTEADRQQTTIFEIVFGASFGLVAADLFGKVERIQVEEMRKNKRT